MLTTTAVADRLASGVARRTVRTCGGVLKCHRTDEECGAWTSAESEGRSAGESSAAIALLVAMGGSADL